jgi:uncharacterized protein
VAQTGPARGRGLTTLLVVVAVLVIVLLVAHQLIRRSYPYSAFNAQRLSDAWAILLGTDTRLTTYEPRPTLQLPRNIPQKMAFPAIDIHFHLGSLPANVTAERLVAGMDAAGIAKVTNLDGRKGNFEEFKKRFHDKYPDRFIMFVKPDFEGVRTSDGIQKQVEWIDEAARMGALGVKVNKSLGLGIRDKDGKLLAIDDRRLDPIWDEAGRLGLPVLIHTGDPPAFYLPLDRFNERYEELIEFPEWKVGGDDPTFEQLMKMREHVLERHPNTKFIGAHIGSNEDDLAYAASLLDRFPNYNVDMSARVASLGRQPRHAREFLMKYQDRVLYGTDGGVGMQIDGDGWTPERYFRAHAEFLETEDEYIEYPQYPQLSQGRWRVYGIGLPKDVLEKIYVLNAQKLLPTPESVAAKLNEPK